MTEHRMMVHGFLAMIFHTTGDEPVTYSSNGIRHYAHQGDKLVACFVEPSEEWMANCE